MNASQNVSVNKIQRFNFITIINNLSQWNYM